MTAAVQLAVCWRYRASGKRRRKAPTTRWKGERAAGYGMEINSEKSIIVGNSIKPMPSTNIGINGKVLGEVNQFKYLRSTQTEDGISLLEEKIRLAQSHPAMTRLAVLWKSKAISIPTKINSTNHLCCQYCSMDVEAGCWMRIWRDESKPLKTNVSGGCFAYYAENTKRTNMHDRTSWSCIVNRQASQVIMVWPCLPSWYFAKNHTTLNSRW